MRLKGLSEGVGTGADAGSSMGEKGLTEPEVQKRNKVRNGSLRIDYV